MCNKATLLALVLIASAVVYQYYKPETDVGTSKIAGSNQKTRVKKDKQDEGKTTRKIAIGLNAAVDYIIPAVELLKALEAAPAMGQMTAHQIITNIEELQQTVAYSMATCSGIERHFGDGDLFNAIVEIASKLKHEEYLGGNAALMAMKVSELLPDSEILLVGPIGPKLRKFTNQPNIRTVSPESTREEVHIIMEYSKGEEWGAARATCANRVIISHDKENSELTSLEEFESSVNSFKPDTVIFAGAHMLDGQPREFWKQRLSDIAKFLKLLPRQVLIHYEMSTAGNLQFIAHQADEILPYIDSLGLNEQELLSLAKSKEAKFDFKAIGSKPAIPDGCDMLNWLFETYSALNRSDSRFTRIHFHSLTYHVIVSSKSELKGSKWKNNLKAVKEGSKIASLQACDTTSIQTSHHELQIPTKFQLSNKDESLQRSMIEYVPENGYVAWLREESNVEFQLAPVYVCKKPLKTVGLGDAISATGLLKSEFTFRKSRKKKH